MFALESPPRDPAGQGGENLNLTEMAHEVQLKIKVLEKKTYELKPQAMEAKEAEGRVSEEERRRTLGLSPCQEGLEPIDVSGKKDSEQVRHCGAA